MVARRGRLRTLHGLLAGLSIRLLLPTPQPLIADRLDQLGDGLIDVGRREVPGAGQRIAGGDDVVLAEDADLAATKHIVFPENKQGGSWLARGAVDLFDL